MAEQALRAAVVLGARNLGGAITRDLLVRGVRVATVARTGTDLEALEAEGAVGICADTADPDQLRGTLARAASEFGSIDLIVNAVSADRPAGTGAFGGGAVAPRLWRASTGGRCLPLGMPSSSCAREHTPSKVMEER